VDTPDWVTAIMASIALLLSGINTYVQWQAHQDKRRRRLRVRGWVRTRPGNPPRPGIPPQEESLEIEVANESQAAITIRDILSRAEHVQVQYRRRYGDEDPVKSVLPHTLAPASMTNFSILWERVLKRLRTTIGGVGSLSGWKTRS
jgi:hypothetical protein